MPKVSVIIPAYNCEKFIHQTITSALNQTFKDIEVLIVDNGSTDGTAEIIKSIKDSRVHYFWQENRGVSSARNTAIKNSNAEFIALLDHDDLWMPDKLEKQLRLFEENPNLGLVFSDTIYFEDSRGDLYSSFSLIKPYRGNVFRQLLRENFILVATVLIRKDALLSLEEWFCENMGMVEDYDLFLRLAYRYEFDYIDEPLAKYRLHSRQSSNVRNYLTIPELKLVLERLKAFIPQFKSKYKQEMEYFKARTDYIETLILWQKGRLKEARKKLLPLYRQRKQVLIIFPFSFFDYRFFIFFKDCIYKIKYKFRQLFKKYKN